MNTENTDRLKSLFQEIKLDEPSTDFESRLMQRVHIVAAKQNRKRSIISILSITFGIVGMLGIPTLIFWLLGLPLKEGIQSMGSNITFNIPSVGFNPFVISVACVGVLLLISDSLIRRRIKEKKLKD